MKKLSIFTVMMAMVMMLASCGKDEYQKFLGTWGVKHIDYYNTDYAGNPIEATFESYDFTPGDTQNGIDLVFRDDKTGEMRDRSRDTLFFDWNDSLEIYETVIVCPDTTLVTKFTYSYNANDGLLFMNMQVAHPLIYQMQVTFIDDDTFEYINEYDYVADYEANKYVEKARLVRYSSSTRGAKSTPITKRHHKSLFSNY